MPSPFYNAYDIDSNSKAGMQGSMSAVTTRALLKVCSDWVATDRLPLLQQDAEFAAALGTRLLLCTTSRAAVLQVARFLKAIDWSHLVTDDCTDGTGAALFCNCGAVAFCCEFNWVTYFVWKQCFGNIVRS